MMHEITMGDVRDFRNFMGAVIDEKSFKKISGYIDDAKKNATIVAGRRRDGDEGYFVEPTLVEAKTPDYRLMCEEIFGPVLTAYVYHDERLAETLDDRGRDLAVRADRRGVRAATGAAVREASPALRNAAGNFYINDKPTGAVVGQQPFGGARASGTNDKAGSKMNLLRWVSARSVKETFSPPRDFQIPVHGGRVDVKKGVGSLLEFCHPADGAIMQKPIDARRFREPRHPWRRAPRYNQQLT